MFFLQKIDNHTDITYSVSAPGGGGLVDSRDFVNLRCWKLVKNGNIIDDVDSVNDSTRLSKESSAKPEPLLKKSTSEMNLSDSQAQATTALNQSVHSLSKSLGAKVFGEETFQSPTPDMFTSNSTTDDVDEFVDANDSQGAESTNDSSHRSEEVEYIKEIASDLCDRMYIVSGTSIKYDRMPTVSKFTRLVLEIDINMH